MFLEVIKKIIKCILNLSTYFQQQNDMFLGHPCVVNIFVWLTYFLGDFQSMEKFAVIIKLFSSMLGPFDSKTNLNR